MPAMIRTSGQMWNKTEKSQDTLAVILIALMLEFIQQQ
jgi:monomeric isocitrate dehydrogenase